MEQTQQLQRFRLASLCEADYARHVEQSGYAIVERAFDESYLQPVRSAIDRLDDGEAVRRKRGIYGVRNLLDICPAVRDLAVHPAISRLVSAVLGTPCFAVRAVFFDKIKDANWSLGWHQDSVISVADKGDVAEFVGWSNKAGVWQVQPPADILAQMLAVRVHLDDCGIDNGPLRVLPASHTYGWLDDEIDRWKAEVAEVVCDARAGDIVVMRPLVLHASAKATAPSHRRVIHIEYAFEELPADLQWRDRLEVLS